MHNFMPDFHIDMYLPYIVVLITLFVMVKSCSLNLKNTIKNWFGIDFGMTILM